MLEGLAYYGVYDVGYVLPRELLHLCLHQWKALHDFWFVGGVFIEILTGKSFKLPPGVNGTMCKWAHLEATCEQIGWVPAV